MNTTVRVRDLRNGDQLLREDGTPDGRRVNHTVLTRDEAGELSIVCFTPMYLHPNRTMHPDQEVAIFRPDRCASCGHEGPTEADVETHRVSTSCGFPKGARVTNGDSIGTVLGGSTRTGLFSNAVNVQWDDCTGPMLCLIAALRVVR